MDFAEYGTALEPIDQDTVVRKKPLSLEEQVARDENGRRRFHGAFTGGFSAGFFNTVGSLEGWQPSEFKSSRSDRNKSKTQRPQDFMDAEDMGEFGIAPTLLQANKDYAKAGANKRKLDIPVLSEGPIPGTPVLSNFLRPVRETVGVKLLKSMGWKPGQGVGPRLTRVEKQKQKKKIYGCAMQPGAEAEDKDEEDGDDDDDDDDDDVNDINLNAITFAPDDWEPYIGQPKDNTFGMGYSGLDRRSVLGTSTKSSSLQVQEKNRKLDIRGQAFGVGAFEEDDEDIYTTEDMSQYDQSLGNKTGEAAELEAQPVVEEGVLEGFKRSRGRGMIKRLFPPPILPKDFVPKGLVRKTRFDAGPPIPERRRDLGRHELNSLARSVLIGEVSPEEVAVKAQRDARALTEKLISEVQLQPSSYRPFSGDMVKQARYDQYLKLVQVGHKERLTSLQPVTMNEWERQREIVEFEQAAKLFRPLTGVMNDRFTRGSLPDDVHDPLATVEKTVHASLDMKNAAKAKMFGRLTRLEEDWRPCSLLCKRFNIPEPNTSVKEKRKPKYSLFDCYDTTIKPEPEETTEQTPEPALVSAVETQAVVELDTVEAPPEEVFKEPESKVDLFKAIFLDSDDEHEDSAPPSTAVASAVEPKNTKRNTSPARGIFENIDLESLNTMLASEPQATASSVAEPEPPLQEDDTYYGPRLPEKRLSSAQETVQPTSDSSIDAWVEKSKKSKKKSKKHKSDKHKHKHKSKKHKR